MKKEIMTSTSVQSLLLGKHSNKHVWSEGFFSWKTLEGKLLLGQVFHSITENTLSVLLSLYLWRVLSLPSVMQFRLYELLLIPVLALVAAYIADRFTVRWPLILGLILSGCVLASLLIWQGELRAIAPLLAVLLGASSVFRFVSWNVIHRVSISVEKEKKYFSQLSILTRIVGVSFPIISGGLIALFGYPVVFGGAILSSGVVIAVLLRIKIPFKTNPYRPFAPYRRWNREVASLFFTNLLWGVEFAMVSTLLPIVVAQTFGGEASWGVITSVIALIGVGYSVLFQRVNIPHQNITAIGVFGILLSTVSIMYAVNQNMWWLLVVLVVIQLWQVTQSIALHPLLNRIVRSDPQANILGSEYQAFMEVPFMLGRAFVFALLFGIGLQLNQALVQGLLFALLGFVPLYESRALGLSKEAKELK